MPVSLTQSLFTHTEIVVTHAALLVLHSRVHV